MSKVAVNLEVEARLLGGAMASQDWANEILASTKPIQYFEPRNRLIWATIAQLASTDQEVTLDKIVDLGASKDLSVDYIVGIFQIGSLRSIELSELIETLRLNYFKRSLQEIAKSTFESITDSKLTEEEILRNLDEQIYSIHGDSTKRKTLQVAWDAVNKPRDYMAQVQDAQHKNKLGEQVFIGIPTGYQDLDRMINSLKPGHLTIVGARPSVGKTTFATNLIENICIKSDQACLFFSLEMPSDEVAKKLLSQISNVPSRKIEKGEINGQEYQQLYAANQLLKNKKILIEDQPSLGIDQIKMRAIRAQKAHNIRFIVIDYLQRITCSKRSESRYIDVGYISGTLKEIAKTLEVPIIALAQLNRESEKRESHKPLMSDLRESGAIEADADEIILLHRPDMYNERDKPGIVELHLCKNRFGETGLVQLNFQKDTGKLRSYVPFVNPSTVNQGFKDLDRAIPHWGDL